MNALTSLSIVAALVIGTMIFAVVSVRRIAMSPQEFIVGNRGFGTIFLWVLLAGEIYTSFTFLGAAGWAYLYGAPAFYIIAYGTVGFIFWYFFLPWVWRFAKERQLLTAPDFFQARYGSRALTLIVSSVLVVAVIPYITLQLTALQIFLTIGGYGAINAQWGAVCAFILLIAFVYATGMRGTAWASIVKDLLVIGALLVAGIAIPVQFFGGIPHMFDQLIAAHPTALLLGAPTAPKGSLWFVSTVLLSGIGFFMGPHSIAAIYSAKSENALRRNAMFLPLYQIVIVLVFFAGFSALLIAPGLKGPQSDQSFLLVVARFYPPFVLGFIAAAGALCALVPSTALVLSSASIAAKNIVGESFGIASSDRARVALTRAFVAIIGALALLLWIAYKTTIVNLLLLYYNGVTQLAPAFVFGYLWSKTSALGVTVGLVAGVALALTLAATGNAPFGINAGLYGLGANVILLVLISLLRKEKEPATASPSTISVTP